MPPIQGTHMHCLNVPGCSCVRPTVLSLGFCCRLPPAAAGDVNSVTIGDKTSVQDNVLIHVAKHNAAGKVRRAQQRTADDQRLCETRTSCCLYGAGGIGQQPSEPSWQFKKACGE